MRIPWKPLLGTALVGAAMALLLRQVPAASAPESPDALQAEIAALKPAKHPWREIAWKSCPLEALKEARQKGRPVLTWVFLGSPVDERC
jgi:hypothetical protein